jgi:hypothetical protein
MTFGGFGENNVLTSANCSLLAVAYFALLFLESDAEMIDFPKSSNGSKVPAHIGGAALLPLWIGRGNPRSENTDET